MIGHSYEEIYVAACGQVFESLRLGRKHERDCFECRVEMCDFEGDDDEDDDDLPE